MSLVRPSIYDGGLQRQALPGDVAAWSEIIATNATVGASTLTAAQLLSGILSRSGSTAGYIDTTDTASNIIAGMVGQYNYQATALTGVSSGVAAPQGLTVRLRIINTVAFANTMAAGTGVTLVNGTINASSVKDYLIQVTNGTPQQIFAVNQTNGSAVLTGMSQFQTSQLSIGMLVTGGGLSGNIISIQTGIGVTLSANASTTVALNAATFSPTVTITGLGQGLL